MKIKWENFKSVRNTGWLEIKPITILIGKNGTGKTALLQPLLLLGQTKESADESVSLMTKGTYVNAGIYSDLVFNHLVDKKIKFNFEYQSSKNEKTKKPRNSKLGLLPPINCELSFGKGADSMPVLTEIKAFDALNREMLSRSLLKNGKYSLKFCNELDNNSKKDIEINKIIEDQKPKHFLFEDREIVRQRIKLSRENGKRNGIIEFSKPISRYLSILSFVEYMMMDFIESIKYIGPLREYPKRFYEYRGEKHPEVGPKGEYTHSLLYKLLQNRDLKDQIEEWLNKFELANEIKCELVKERPDLLEITIKPPSTEVFVNYSDSCIGVSQILPILVQTLMCKKNDIIITEQPEIHLNPYCETTLADFFVDAVNKTKCSFIVETHSEHYLMRLRTHVRKGLISNEKIAVYYLDRIDGESKIRLLEMDDKGNFKNNDWPKGFFEQSLTESMMFATAKRGSNDTFRK